MFDVQKTSHYTLALSSLFIFATIPANAKDKAITEIKKHKTEHVVPLPNRVDMSIKPGNIRNISEMNVWSPLTQSRDNVKFLSFIGKKDTKDSNELNMGYGERTIINNDYIVGYYGYWDVRRTSHDNLFNQITVGAEYLSDPLDLRFNGYVPINKFRNIHTPAQVSQSSTGMTVSSANREYALGGWDLEAGTSYRFTKDNSIHVYAARFDFRSKRTKAITGNRYRTEIRFNNLSKYLPLNSRFTWGWETQRDKVRGRARYSMFRLSIPLYTPNNIPEKLSGLRRRLIDPIIRDVDIVAGLNTKTEQAYYADTSGKATGKATGIKTVGTGADLYHATTNGKEGEIILVNKDITTSLEMTLQKNQKLITTGQSVKLVTPSGVSVDYVPQYGSRKTLKNTLPEGQAMSLSEGAEVKGLKVIKTVYTNSDDDSAADYMTTTREEEITMFMPKSSTVVLNAGDSNSYHQITPSTTRKSTLTYSMKCLGTDSSGEPTMVDCATKGLAVDSQGRVRITDANFKKVDSQLTVTDADGKSSSVFLTVLSKTGLSELKTSTEAILKNDEQYGDSGIRLLYGDDFKCAGDGDTAGGTCDKDPNKEKKIDEVKKTLAGYLNPNNPHTEKIKAALRKSKPTMSLFDKASQKKASSEYLNYLGNVQDLQATETFVNAKGNKGGNTAGTARSAAVEELIHMVHNYGITKALPDWQERLDKATADALADGKLSGWEKNDLPRRDLDDEYFADGVEAYFNMRAGGGVTSRSSLCGSLDLGGDAGSSTQCSTVGKSSRDMLRDNHKPLYDLVHEIFGDRTELY